MTWIKTAEQLPPKDCYVLGYTMQTKVINDDLAVNVPNERIFCIGKLTDDKYYPFHALSFDCTLDDLLYWAHFPAPPKEDKQ